MDTVGRSTLRGKVCKLLGFAFDKHPIRKNWSVHIVFYQVVNTDQFLISMGEVKGKGKPEEMRPNLGSDVPGDLIAPYVQRGLAGVDYDKFKSIMAEGFPTLKIEWWQP